MRDKLFSAVLVLNLALGGLSTCPGGMPSCPMMATASSAHDCCRDRTSLSALDCCGDVAARESPTLRAESAGERLSAPAQRSVLVTPAMLAAHASLTVVPWHVRARALSPPEQTLLDRHTSLLL
jgi:hypothetical protein